jgi:hypothetical protein
MVAGLWWVMEGLVKEEAWRREENGEDAFGCEARKENSRGLLV